MADKGYIDPEGYWIDPSRNVRRMGDEDEEQAIVLKATKNCSDAEWEHLFKAIADCLLLLGHSPRQ
jgi:hypothetical protein